MDFAAIAAEWWLKWAFGIVAAGIAFGFRMLYKRQKAAEKRQAALEAGMQAILRDRILEAYYHYQKRGNITLHGLDNVEKMFSAYDGLNGNGTVPRLVQAMREMDVVDE